MNPVRKNINMSDFLKGEHYKRKYLDDMKVFILDPSIDEDFVWKSAYNLFSYKYWPVEGTDLNDFCEELKVHKLLLNKKSDRICYIICMLQIKIKRFVLGIQEPFGRIDPDLKELDDELLGYYVNVEEIVSKINNKILAETSLKFLHIIHDRIVMKWLVSGMSYNDSRIDFYARKIKKISNK